MIRTLHREQFIPGDPALIWDFFASPRNLVTLTPASLRFKIISELPPRMYAGQMIEYDVGVLPGITTRWLTEITHLREGECFVDEQRLGPYKLWHHEHRFVPTENGRGVHMSDRVIYDVGWGLLGRAVDAWWVRRQLTAIFDFRARKIDALFPN